MFNAFISEYRRVFDDSSELEEKILGKIKMADPGETLLNVTRLKDVVLGVKDRIDGYFQVDDIPDVIFFMGP